MILLFFEQGLFKVSEEKKLATDFAQMNSDNNEDKARV